MIDLFPTPADHRSGRLEFEKLIAEVSARFVNLPAAEVDREIEDALSRISELLGIDYSLLWRWSSEAPDVIAPTHIYCALPGPPPGGPLDEDQFPWYRQQMLAGRMVVAHSLEDLPEEASVDRASCESVGVKSNLTIPLSVGGDPPIGCLGFNALRKQRDWPEELVTRLHLVAQVFTNALARQRHELRASGTARRTAGG